MPAGARLNAFNRTHGMMSGLTVALAVIGVAALVRGQFDGWPRVDILYAATALVLAWLSWWRFYRFGKAYARDLLVQFIELPA